MRELRRNSLALAVIMAGGSGTRFWPRSRTDRPKQLLSITGDEILLKKTVELIKPIIPPKRIKIVTTLSQAGSVKEILTEVEDENIILEPFGRNTAPAIGISTLYVERDDPDAVMVVLPADHYIEDHEKFRETIMAGVYWASQGNCIVIIGIPPKGPETGYGYIETGTLIDKKDRIFSVISFHEKPDMHRAKGFLKQGTYFWNSGIFIAKASTMLREIAECLPRNYTWLMAIRTSLGKAEEQKVIRDAYQEMEAISIDYGVIEKTKNVLMVEGNFGWDDVGSWPSAAQYWPTDSDNNACIGEIINLDSSRCVVHSPKKLVALLGVEDLVIVEEDDVLLVCKKDRSQDVRRIVELLRSMGRDHIL
jgi:mannose-1-phosphate guanylyltransferase